MSSRVVILAGGKGTRLRPFTATFPKPLVPLGNMPILEVLIRQLRAQGFRHVTLTLGHLSTLIRAFLVQHKQLNEGMQIDFVDEEVPTGTSGSLASVAGLTDAFLVMNGDVLTDLSFRELMNDHKRSGAALTIATHRKEVKIDLGVIQANEYARVIQYLEKPSYEFEVSMGVYVYEPRIVALIKPGQYLDLPNLVQILLERGEHVHLHRNEAFWLDIGRPEDYASAQDLFAKEPSRFLPTEAQVVDA